MVCPLLSFEEEMVRSRVSPGLCAGSPQTHPHCYPSQVQTFDLDFGMKAITLNSKNGGCSPLVIGVRACLPSPTRLTREVNMFCRTSLL